MSAIFTSFLLGAGSLVIVALLFLLRPWPIRVKHNERLSKRSAIALCVLLPLCALSLYVFLGTPAALTPQLQPSAESTDVEKMLWQLESKLEKNPNNPQGWQMLARSYVVLGRYAEAVQAFSHLKQEMAKSPDLLADYAKALAFKQNGSMQGEPDKLVLRALKLAPTHPSALLLAGSAAFERKDYRDAISYWQRLQKQLAPDSEDAQMMRESIRLAREKMGLSAEEK